MNMIAQMLSPTVAPTLESISLSSGENSKAKMEAASREFESVFLSLLLKEMRNSLDNDGEGGLFAGEKSDTLGGMFDMYIGQHLASSEALGIAKLMQTYMANQYNSMVPDEGDPTGKEDSN